MGLTTKTSVKADSKFLDDSFRTAIHDTTQSKFWLCYGSSHQYGIVVPPPLSGKADVTPALCPGVMGSRANLMEMSTKAMHNNSACPQLNLTCNYYLER